MPSDLGNVNNNGDQNLAQNSAESVTVEDCGNINANICIGVPSGTNPQDIPNVEGTPQLENTDPSCQTGQNVTSDITLSETCEYLSEDATNGELRDPKKINPINAHIKSTSGYDSSIDDRLPETVKILTTETGVKLYLIGTAHFSEESQKDVSMIMQAVQPQRVVIELCKSRIGILKLDEETIFGCAKNLTYSSIVDTFKEHGAYTGLFHVLLSRMAAHLSDQLHMAPGGEFRRAYEEAQKIPNCLIFLGDRPIDITIQRAVRSLDWYQILKVSWMLLFMKPKISKEEVEQCKRQNELDQLVTQLKVHFPALGEVFVTERDIHLTYILQVACTDGDVPERVVGIVGLGHMTGIVQHWGKVKREDVLKLLSIPPQRLSTKILKFTFKATLLGAIVYMGYKYIPFPSALMLESIKSSAERLLEVKRAMVQ